MKVVRFANSYNFALEVTNRHKKMTHNRYIHINNRAVPPTAYVGVVVTDCSTTCLLLRTEMECEI